MNTIELVKSEKEVALGIARAYAPFKYGNLRFNAIKLRDMKDGFKIVYSLEDAFYIYFQEEGTRYSQKNKGFIAYRTYPALASYFYGKYQTGSPALVNYYMEKSREGNRDIFKEQNRITMLDMRASEHMASLLSKPRIMAQDYLWGMQINESFPDDLNRFF